MVRVLGRANSINVQKVMWCAAELGVDVDRIDIGGAYGGNDQPEFLSKNPNGRVPVLEDGDLILWESNTIVRYLCRTYGDAPWRPDDVTVRAHASQWMDWYLSSLHAPMTVIFWALIRTAPQDRDAAAVAKAVEDASKLWAIINAHLADRDFITGEAPSMGDIPIGCAAYRWHEMDIDRPDLPNLLAWWQRLRDRPAYRDNVMLPLT